VSDISWLVIRSEEDQFNITTSDGIVFGPTLEMALILAIQNAGIEGVELAPTLEAAEVLESLLGANV